MKLSAAKVIKYLVIAIIAVLISFFWSRKEKVEHSTHIRDYEEIIAADTLRVVTEYNSISFFVDADSVSGFHYELIRAFANSKGIEVSIIPEMSFEKRLQGLQNGAFDIIAYGIPLTSDWKDSLSLTTPITRSRQILVQRQPDEDSINTHIQSQIDLAGKTLYVEKGSPSILRIRNLGNEIADTIYIQEVERYGQEQLISMVAHGDIDYAVTDENIASALIDSFPQLDINTGIGFTQFYAWGVNKQSPELLDSLNNWLSSFLETKQYQDIYRKYFKKD